MPVRVFPVVGAKPTPVGSTCPLTTKRHSLQISTTPPNIYVTIILHPLHSSCCFMRMCHSCKTSCQSPFQLASGGGPTMRRSNFRQCTSVFVAHLHTLSGDQLQNTPLEVTIASKNFNRRARDTFLSHRIHLLA